MFNGRNYQSPPQPKGTLSLDISTLIFILQVGILAPPQLRNLLKTNNLGETRGFLSQRQ